MQVINSSSFKGVHYTSLALVIENANVIWKVPRSECEQLLVLFSTWFIVSIATWLKSMFAFEMEIAWAAGWLAGQVGNEKIFRFSREASSCWTTILST